MSKRKRPKSSSDGPEMPSGKRSAGRPSTREVSVRRDQDGAWELVHPRCAAARQEDLEEVGRMVAAGEADIARDELRWLLSQCHDFIAAHKMLGDLALGENDFRLARGHFGYAYQLGLQAIAHGGRVKPLPYAKAGNQSFFEAGRSLASCLARLGKRELAREVIGRLLELDPADPLDLRPQLSSGVGAVERSARQEGGRRRGRTI